MAEFARELLGDWADDDPKPKPVNELHADYIRAAAEQGFELSDRFKYPPPDPQTGKAALRHFRDLCITEGLGETILRQETRIHGMARHLLDRIYADPTQHACVLGIAQADERQFFRFMGSAYNQQNFLLDVRAHTSLGYEDKIHIRGEDPHSKVAIEMERFEKFSSPVFTTRLLAPHHDWDMEFDRPEMWGVICPTKVLNEAVKRVEVAAGELAEIRSLESKALSFSFRDPSFLLASLAIGLAAQTTDREAMIGFSDIRVDRSELAIRAIGAIAPKELLEQDPEIQNGRNLILAGARIRVFDEARMRLAGVTIHYSNSGPGRLLDLRHAA